MPVMLRTSKVAEKIFESIQGKPVNKQKAKKLKASKMENMLTQQESSRLR